MDYRKYLIERGWPAEQVRAMTEDEFDEVADLERQAEQSATLQQIAHRRLLRLEAEIAEIKSKIKVS